MARLPALNSHRSPPAPHIATPLCANVQNRWKPLERGRGCKPNGLSAHRCPRAFPVPDFGSIPRSVLNPGLGNLAAPLHRKKPTDDIRPSPLEKAWGRRRARDLPLRSTAEHELAAQPKKSALRPTLLCRRNYSTRANVARNSSAASVPEPKLRGRSASQLPPWLTISLTIS